MRRGVTGWMCALALGPALAMAQGHALGPDPTAVWEGNVDYAATAASLLRCTPGTCAGSGHNCDGLSRAAATLDVIPESPTLRIVHARLNWVGSTSPDQMPDEQVTLVPPGGDPVAVTFDEDRSERFDDPLDAASCQLIGTLCPAAAGNCGLRFFSYHADVTEALRAHRADGGSLNGEWEVRDVEIPGARDDDPGTAVAAVASIALGGWSLFVVYEDAERLPLRRVYYYQGFELLEGQNRTVRPRGFLAPADPAVDVTYFVIEGDADIRGDALTINGQEVADACNPNRNTYNGTVNTGRADGQCLRGVQGIDLDRFRVEGAVRPGDEEAEVTFILPRGDGLITPGEQLFTGWLILAFDHRLPSFDTLKPQKQAEPPSGSVVQPGGEITYAIQVENTGGDFARNVVVTDPVPDGTTYVRGSTAVDRRPVADLPGGESPLAHGLNLTDLPDIEAIEPGAQHLVQFTVTVDPDLPPESLIRNVARIDADDIDPVSTDPVVHSVGRLPDGGIPPPDAGRPPRDAGEAPADAGPPRRDSGWLTPDAAGPPRDDAGGADGECPAGFRRTVSGRCERIPCPDSGVACDAGPADPCGPGTRLGPDGRCESICGEGLKWDPTCPGGGQCRHEADPPCQAGGEGAADGCGCAAAGERSAPAALLLVALLAALRPRRGISRGAWR